MEEFIEISVYNTIWNKSIILFYQQTGRFRYFCVNAFLNASFSSGGFTEQTSISMSPERYIYMIFSSVSFLFSVPNARTLFKNGDRIGGGFVLSTCSTRYN